MKQELLSYEQAVERFGSNEALRWSIIRFDFPVYVWLKDACVGPFDAKAVASITDGQTAFCSWSRRPPWAEAVDDAMDSTAGDVCYWLNGWFRLPPDTARAIARHDGYSPLLVTQLDISDPESPAQLAMVSRVLKEVAVRTDLADTWCRETDVNRFLSDNPQGDYQNDASRDGYGATIDGNVSHSTRNAPNRSPSTYMPLIHALAIMAKVLPQAPNQSFAETLSSRGCGSVTTEATERALQAAFDFTLTRYDMARDRSPNPYMLDRSVYLPIIHALAKRADLYRRGSVPAVLRELAELKFKKPGKNTVSDVLLEARTYVERAQVNDSIVNPQL